MMIEIAKIEITVQSDEFDIGIPSSSKLFTEAIFQILPCHDSERIFIGLSCLYKNDTFLAPAGWQLMYGSHT